MSISVTASRYNQLRQRIALIMGNSTNTLPSTGYGQDILSEDVTGVSNQPNLSNVNKVSAIDYRNIYLDLARARIHQIGTTAFLQTPFPIGDILNNANANKIELAYIQALENLMTQIENDQFLLNIANQGEIINLRNASSQNIQSVRTTSWGGAGQTQVVNHIFTVTFSSVAARRHFFNTGGELRFEASLAYTGSEAKTVNWRNMLTNMGTIIFRANTTTRTGQGTAANVGNYQLTTSNTQIFRIFGTAVYSANSYRILARNLSTTQMEFTIEFRDDDVGSGPAIYRIDEPVRGTLTSGPVRFVRANGSATINGVNTSTVVITETPVGNTTSNL
jgi:hypothetical protein